MQPPYREYTPAEATALAVAAQRSTVAKPDPGRRVTEPEWFHCSGIELARKLLGCVLERRTPDGEVLRARIVECEPYLGVSDKAAHSFGGRRGPKNEHMYSAPGTHYVYLIYGMYHCINFRACDEGPTAVLLRGLEPLSGHETMQRNRSVPVTKNKRALLNGKIPIKTMKPTDLCSGPGRLCHALGIDLTVNGTSSCTHETLHLLEGEAIAPEDVVISPRVGVDYGKEWAKLPLRFSVRDNPHVSRPNPAAAAHTETTTTVTTVTAATTTTTAPRKKPAAKKSAAKKAAAVVAETSVAEVTEVIVETASTTVSRAASKKRTPTRTQPPRKRTRSTPATAETDGNFADFAFDGVVA